MTYPELRPYTDKIVNSLLKLHHKTTENPLSLLVDDLFCDFGAKHDKPITEDARKILFEAASVFTEAVIAHPYRDILGPVYEELSSRGHRSCMGQYFTPHAVCEMMTQITFHDCWKALRTKASKNETMMVSEPACGAGAMILSVLGMVANSKEPELLEYIGFVAVDKERLCAKMCAIQVMCNLFIHNGTLGEFSVIWGDSLTVETYATIVQASHKGRSPYISPNLDKGDQYFFDECEKMASHWHKLLSPKQSFPISL